MADPVINQFEIERRVITWSPLTTLNDGITPLGYDGDPNLVSPTGTPGEQWLYNLPIGQFYKQSDATLWWKNGTPNTWTQVLGGSSSTSVVGTYSGATVSVGDAVTTSAADTVVPALASDASQNPVIGICIQKPDASTALIQLAGEVSVFPASTFTANKKYWLSNAVAGALVNDVSTYSTGDVVQLVGVSKSDSVLTLLLHAPTEV